MFAGVYLLGGVEPPFAREAAAVLACGPGALLSHRTAAWLWGLIEAVTGAVELTVVGRARRSPAGIKVRSIGHLGRGELRRRHGLPLTSPSLTILDLAGLLERDELADLVARAIRRGLASKGDLRATVAEHPKRAGGRALARLLDSSEMSMTVESRAEARCLRLMIRHHLKPDRSQARIGPYRVDFLYERERLVVEVDGFAYHGDRKPFDRDRRRSAYLTSRGYAVFPITWTDLDDAPHQTMAGLRLALSNRRLELVPR